MLDAQVKAKELRGFLDQVYNTSGKKEDLKSLSDDEVFGAGKQPAWRCADGNPGLRRRARGRDSPHARAGGEDPDGQTQLYDGRTGEAFERR
jgi:DNA-directed RNA polymerase subunit beta